MCRSHKRTQEHIHTHSTASGMMLAANYADTVYERENITSQK